jgi:hypothetical protein
MTDGHGAGAGHLPVTVEEAGLTGEDGSDMRLIVKVVVIAYVIWG